MVTPINHQWSVSKKQLKTLFEAENKDSATRLSFVERFADFFRNILGLETKKSQVNRFYEAIIKESKTLQNTKGKSYLDPDIKKVLFFAKMRVLADTDKQDQFKITLNNGEASFSIGDTAIYRSAVSQYAARFITEKGTSADGVVKAKFAIRAAILEDTEQATLIRKNQVAAKLQPAIQAHRKYQNDIIDKGKKEGLKYVRKAYRGDNHNAKQGPVEFWVPVNRQGPVIHTPVNQPATPASGGFKKLYTQDSSLVALIPNGTGDFLAESQVDNSDLATLNLTTVNYYGEVVDAEKKLIIARNAGEPLQGKILPATVFENAANDLKTLHDNGICLRDINPNNLTLKTFANGRQQINFIDVDERINKKQNKKIYPVITPLIVTYSLVNKLYNNPGTSRYELFRTADEYAFLLSMIRHTTDDNKLVAAIEKPKLAHFKLVHFQNANIDVPAFGAMKLNKAHFFPWITQHIKPEHRADAERLLTDPAEFAKNFPKHPALADMLQF